MFFSGLNNLNFARTLDGLSGTTPLSIDRIANEVVASAAKFSPYLSKFDSFRTTILYGTKATSDAPAEVGLLAYFQDGKYGVVRSDNQPANSLNNDQIIQLINAKRNVALSTDSASNLTDIFNDLRNNGLYVVPNQAASNSAAPQQTQGQPASSAIQQPIGQGQSISVTQQGQPAPQNRTIRTKQVRKMSPQEKTRLVWILGIGGLIFAITIGVLASE